MFIKNELPYFLWQADEDNESIIESSPLSFVFPQMLYLKRYFCGRGKWILSI